MSATRSRHLVGLGALLALCGCLGPAAARPSLADERAKLKIPPAWLSQVEPRYNTANPWKDARQEIRRRLAGNRQQIREAIKLTWLYRQKGDIGDGHEYPMYVMMGGEHCWATVAYEEFIKAKLAAGDPQGSTHAYLSLASLYRYYGEWAKAEKVLQQAYDHRPAAPWRIARTADIHAAYGDLYADSGQTEKAKGQYQKAIDLLPTSDQPWGRHLLTRHVTRLRSKLELLSRASLDVTRLRDGTYTATSIGYNGDVKVTVTLRGGRITDVKLQHEDKIEQGASRIIPQRILQAQSVKVDGITGATITVDAILDGAYRALKQAGLR